MNVTFDTFVTNRYDVINSVGGDSAWAPPSDECLQSPKRCSGNAPPTTIDVYRAHDNSTFALVLENSNAADAGMFIFCNLNLIIYFL